MKIWELIKDIRFKRIYKKEKTSYSVSLNNIEIEKLEIKTFSSHSQIYKMLRFLNTPIFNQGYLFRNKKGFNTILFRQNYDVIITDKNSTVIETIINCERGFVSRHYEKGFNVFFFAVGTINHYRINKKDTFKMHHNFIKILDSI